jgi:hypothetical protein
MGSMAKYTLASNAARHAELLALLKRDAKTAPCGAASGAAMSYWNGQQ